jgi:hypothetical protein
LVASPARLPKVGISGQVGNRLDRRRAVVGSPTAGRCLDCGRAADREAPPLGPPTGTRLHAWVADHHQSPPRSPARSGVSGISWTTGNANVRARGERLRRGRGRDSAGRTTAGRERCPPASPARVDGGPSWRACAPSSGASVCCHRWPRPPPRPGNGESMGFFRGPGAAVGGDGDVVGRQGRRLHRIQGAGVRTAKGPVRGSRSRRGRDS